MGCGQDTSVNSDTGNHRVQERSEKLSAHCQSEYCLGSALLGHPGFTM